jgi:hypothetical protein
MDPQRKDGIHLSTQRLIQENAQTIARMMARKSVSPGGVGSGIRMIQYFINRAGKTLSMTRKRELEKAKRILQRKRKSTNKAPTRRGAASRKR